MKKLYFIMIVSSILFTGCNTLSAKPGIKRPKVVELNTSNLGIVDTNVSKEVHLSYSANDEKEKLFNEVKRIETYNKVHPHNDFNVYMANHSKK